MKCESAWRGPTTQSTRPKQPPVPTEAKTAFRSNGGTATPHSVLEAGASTWTVKQQGVPPDCQCIEAARLCRQGMADAFWDDVPLWIRVPQKFTAARWCRLAANQGDTNA